MVYEGVSRLAPPREEVFTNQMLVLGGSPLSSRYGSTPRPRALPLALEADDATSPAGVLYFDGTVYGTSQRLCLPGATTFFSVYASTSGVLRAATNGRVWIDGYSGRLSERLAWLARGHVL